MGQYIGARYVPRFMGVYDPTQIYEALDVVDNGLGTSYISKIPTPAGTPLTNTTYWAIYGASSGAIINLQNQINDMQDGTVPGSLQNQINEMQDGTVSGSLQDQINDNTSNITALTNIADPAPHRMICITDSYGTHDTSINWCTILRDLCGLSGSDFYFWAEGSSGFEHAGLSGHTFLQLLQIHENSISNPNTITDVFVGGGTNDFYYFNTATSLTNAMRAMASYIRSTYPNARMHYVFMGYESIMSSTMRTHYIDTITCYESMRYVEGVDVINAYQPMHVGIYREDHQHPNNDGSYAIARIIYNSLFNNPFRIAYQGVDLVITPDTGLTIADNKAKFAVYDDESVISLQHLFIQGTIPMGVNNIVKIGTLDGLRANCPITAMRFDTSAIMRDTLNNDSVVPVSFFFQADTVNNVIELYMISMRYSGTTNAIGLRINGISRTVPLEIA